MMGKLEIARRGCLVVLVGALVTVGLVSSASAYTGEFAKFNYCPVTNKEVFRRLYAVTIVWTIVLGKKTTTIETPVTLQGGYTATNREKKRISTFFGATKGIEGSKRRESAPGGPL